MYRHVIVDPTRLSQNPAGHFVQDPEDDRVENEPAGQFKQYADPLPLY